MLKKLSLSSLVLATVILGFGSSIAQATTYTTADIATHNTSSDCWVIINNNVYNLTSFLSTHSGGASVITPVCGKNGTSTFNSGPHSTSTLSAISSSIIGTLGTSTVSPVLSSISVVPSSPVIIIGGNIHVKGTPLDQNSKKFEGATTAFTSSNPLIATINSTSGLVTGVAIGTTTITVTSTSGTKTVTGTSVVTVSETSPTLILSSVKIIPQHKTIKIGKTIKLKVVTKDQNGKKFDGATTTFSSSDTNIATVGINTGIVTGVAKGSVTITATSSNSNQTVTDTATVKVVNITNKDNTGKHLGEYKKWFENFKDKFEKKLEKMEDKNEHQNENHQENDNEVENDD